MKKTVQKTGYSIEELAVDMQASATKQLTAADIDQFANITGDNNPIHLDANYAAQTPFKTRIAHGMLNGGLISAVLGMQLPGPGCVYLEQQLKFRAPVKLDDTVITKVTVTEVNNRRHRVTLKTECYVKDKLVTSGFATMMVNGRPN